MDQIIKSALQIRSDSECFPDLPSLIVVTLDISEPYDEASFVNQLPSCSWELVPNSSFSAGAAEPV